VEKGDWIGMRFAVYLDAGGKLGTKVESNMEKEAKLYRFEVGKGTAVPNMWDKITLYFVFSLSLLPLIHSLSLTHTLSLIV
jgi:hypothetical protein